MASAGEGGLDAWLVVDFSQPLQRVGQVLSSAPMRDADASLGVSIVIYASSNEWVAIGNGGLARVIEAVERKSLSLSGKLPYFIRHARSVVDVAYCFSQCVLRVSNLPLAREVI